MCTKVGGQPAVVVAWIAGGFNQKLPQIPSSTQRSCLHRSHHREPIVTVVLGLVLWAIKYIPTNNALVLQALVLYNAIDTPSGACDWDDQVGH